MRVCAYRKFSIAVTVIMMTAMVSVCNAGTYRYRYASNSTFLSQNNRVAIKDSLIKVYRNSSALDYKHKSILLMNIIDLSADDSTRFKYSRELLSLAKANNDDTNQLIALYSLNSENQPELQKYLNVAAHLKKSPAAAEMVQYYRYNIEIAKADKLDKDGLNELLRERINKYRKHRYSDMYEEEGDLMIIVRLISMRSSGELYERYLSYLKAIIDKMPSDISDGNVNYLSIIYYNQSALYFSKHNKQKQALEANRQQLKIYDAMQRRYLKHGRVYVSMNQYKYVCYRRMLAYNEVLSGTQMDSLIYTMKQMAEEDPVIHGDLYDKNSIAFARYYMSKNEYKKAIPYLDNALGSNADSLQWMIPEALKLRIKAGIAINDNTMHKYLLWYEKVLENEKKEGLADKRNELDILYDIGLLKQQDSRKLSIIIFFSGILVFLAIVIMVWLLMRSVSIKSSLRITKENLIKERDDLTKAMDDLRRAEDAANKASSKKVFFLQNLSHEVRTPLNSIMGFSQLIADGKKNLTKEEYYRCVGLVSKNCRLLDTLISDVLDISGMESGTINFVPTVFSANDLCSDAVKSVESFAKPGVQIIFRNNHEDVNLHSDAKRVAQILINYLTNACKFTNKGSIVLEYYYNQASDSVIFTVSDTGIGILPENADVVFDRFTKLDRFSQGNGLGLHICKLIAEGLHGSVYLDKNYTVGSRFVFELPVKGSVHDR